MKFYTLTFLVRNCLAPYLNIEAGIILEFTLLGNVRISSSINSIDAPVIAEGLRRIRYQVLIDEWKTEDPPVAQLFL